MLVYLIAQLVRALNHESRGPGLELFYVSNLLLCFVFLTATFVSGEFFMSEITILKYFKLIEYTLRMFNFHSNINYILHM